MFKALYDLVEHVLSSGPKLSNLILYDVYSESTTKTLMTYHLGLMSTKELLALCPSVVPQN